MLSYYFSCQKYQSLYTLLVYNSGSVEGRKGEHTIMVKKFALYSYIPTRVILISSLVQLKDSASQSKD